MKIQEISGLEMPSWESSAFSWYLKLWVCNEISLKVGVDGDENPAASPGACQQLEFETSKEKEPAKEALEKLVRWE